MAVVAYPSPYANLQKCTECGVLLGRDVVECPVCKKEESDDPEDS